MAVGKIYRFDLEHQAYLLFNWVVDIEVVRWFLSFGTCCLGEPGKNWVRLEIDRKCFGERDEVFAQAIQKIEVAVRQKVAELSEYPDLSGNPDFLVHYPGSGGDISIAMKSRARPKLVREIEVPTVDFSLLDQTPVELI